MQTSSTDAQAADERFARLRLAAALGDGATVRQNLDVLTAMGPSWRAAGEALAAEEAGDHTGAVRALDGLTGVPAALHGLISVTLCRALVGLGEFDEALRTIDDRLARVPDDPDARAAHARALFQKREVKPAIAELEAVLTDHPDHFEARFGLGVSMLAMGRMAQASGNLRKAHALAPLHPGPIRALASLLRMAGQPAKGIAFLEPIMEGQPLLNTPAMMMELAELYAAAPAHDDLPALLRAIEGFARVGPGHAMELGRLWFELGDTAEIRRLAGLVQHRAVSASLRGLAHDLSADTAAARAAYREATDAGGTWVAHARLAELCADAGDTAAAAEHLAQAQAGAGHTPEVRVAAALVALASGDRAGGEPVLKFASTFPGMRQSLRDRAARALQA